MSELPIPSIEVDVLIQGVLQIFAETLEDRFPSAVTHPEDALNLSNYLLRGSTRDFEQMVRDIQQHADFIVRDRENQ